jgi:adenine phosphoribosyltransferase
MSETRETYPVEVHGVKRDLRLFEVAPGVRIAILNILGDVELTEAAALGLAEKLAGLEPAAIVTAEAKSIPLAYALARVMKLPYVVLRKDCKSYMGDVIEATTESITTGRLQTLYLDEKDRALIKDARVALVDDVISTGSTLKGMKSIMDKVGAEVVAEAAIFTEGDETEWAHIVSLGHLPVFAS